MTVIADHLPHRPPFLLVDRILVREPGVRVVAEKLLTEDLPSPVLLIEMLAQAAGFLEGEPLQGQRIFLAGIQDARFEAPARAGDRLRLEVAPERSFAGLMKVRGAVHRGEEPVGSASFLVKRL